MSRAPEYDPYGRCWCHHDKIYHNKDQQCYYGCHKEEGATNNKGESPKLVVENPVEDSLIEDYDAREALRRYYKDQANLFGDSAILWIQTIIGTNDADVAAGLSRLAAHFGRLALTQTFSLDEPLCDCTRHKYLKQAMMKKLNITLDCWSNE